MPYGLLPKINSIALLSCDKLNTASDNKARMSVIVKVEPGYVEKTRIEKPYH